MRKSTKAALLSGLVFPGLGHLVLKRYLRGVTLIVVAFVATWMLVAGTVHRAMEVVDRIESGEVAPETGEIEKAIADSASNTGFPVEDVSLGVFLVAWLVGIADCIRLGREANE